MKNSILRISFPGLILLIAVAFPLQAQETNNDNPFIEQGTILTGVLLGFTIPDYSVTTDVFDKPQGKSAITGIQLDALYFVTNNIGVGPILSYQSLYTNYSQSSGEYIDWNFKYGLQVGGYLPVKTIFGGNSRSQLFLKGAISWLKRDKTFKGSYNLGYKIGIGSLIPLGKRVAVELALNYLVRSENIKNIVVYDYVPPGIEYPQTTIPYTVWHENLTLSVGFKVAL